MNKLYFGDNLTVLREHIRDETVDLIYLDPPFNSRATHNVLFSGKRGQKSQAQVEAFQDTWSWGPVAEYAYDEVMRHGGNLALIFSGLRKWRGDDPLMAYIAMMGVRLIELHRVLKPTGSLYLHCDPTAGHYLKLLLDALFRNQMRAEVVWKRSSAHSDGKQGARQPGRIHDTIYFYAKGDSWTWNPVYTPYDADYLETEYKRIAADGRRYKETDLTAAKAGGDVSYDWRVKRRDGAWIADLDEEWRKPRPAWDYAAVHPYRGRYWAYSKANMIAFARNGRLIHRSTGMPRLVQFADEMPGVPLQDLWTDIPPLAPLAQERLGYPTQKPLALLERIISASSAAGEVVLDPFCGCGTAVDAAQKLDRRWIGIDITHYAVTLIEKRMKAWHPTAQYSVQGRPTDLDGAHDLAQRDKHQFQWWAAWRLGAQRYREEKKGPDRGIDGRAQFKNGPFGDGWIIISVKGGDNVGVHMVRDLRGVMEREEAEMGVLITLTEPTPAMVAEAAAAGFVSKSAHGRLPRLQIVTVADMLDGRMPRLPPLPVEHFVRGPSPRRKKRNVNQLELLLPFAGPREVMDRGDFIDPRYLDFGEASG